MRVILQPDEPWTWYRDYAREFVRRAQECQDIGDGQAALAYRKRAGLHYEHAIKLARLERAASAADMPALLAEASSFVTQPTLI